MGGGGTLSKSIVLSLSEKRVYFLGSKCFPFKANAFLEGTGCE